MVHFPLNMLFTSTTEINLSASFLELVFSGFMKLVHICSFRLMLLLLLPVKLGEMYEVQGVFDYPRVASTLRKSNHWLRLFKKVKSNLLLHICDIYLLLKLLEVSLSPSLFSRLMTDLNALKLMDG